MRDSVFLKNDIITLPIHAGVLVWGHIHVCQAMFPQSRNEFTEHLVALKLCLGKQIRLRLARWQKGEVNGPNIFIFVQLFDKRKRKKIKQPVQCRDTFHACFDQTFSNNSYHHLYCRFFWDLESPSRRALVQD